MLELWKARSLLVGSLESQDEATAAAVALGVVDLDDDMSAVRSVRGKSQRWITLLVRITCHCCGEGLWSTERSDRINFCRWTDVGTLAAGIHGEGDHDERLVHQLGQRPRPQPTPRMHASGAHDAIGFLANRWHFVAWPAPGRELAILRWLDSSQTRRRLATR